MSFIYVVKSRFIVPRFFLKTVKGRSDVMVS